MNENQDNEVVDLASFSKMLIGELQRIAKSPTVQRLALSVDEMASALGVPRRTLEGEIQKGRIKTRKIGRKLRIPMDEVQRYLEIAQ